MKLYFAGAESIHPNHYGLVKRVLLSFANKKIGKYLPIWDDIFIDSGAFTAFTTGKKINHKEYIRFIKENNIKKYASLDVIGNAEGSKKNYLKEIKEGLNPIPAFHYGEKIDYLKFYLDNAPYIALGGVAQLARNRSKLFRFFDKCYSLISKHQTNVKIHGFAVNSIDLLKRYPFYSVDATTWKNGSKFRSLINNNYRQIGLGRAGMGDYQREKGRAEAKKDIRIFNVMYADNNEKFDHYNINKLLKLEKYITDLWTKRGVIWNE